MKTSTNTNISLLFRKSLIREDYPAVCLPSLSDFSTFCTLTSAAAAALHQPLLPDGQMKINNRTNGMEMSCSAICFTARKSNSTKTSRQNPLGDKEKVQTEKKPLSDQSEDELLFVDAALWAKEERDHQAHSSKHTLVHMGGVTGHL